MFGQRTWLAQDRLFVLAQTPDLRSAAAEARHWRLFGN